MGTKKVEIYISNFGKVENFLNKKLVQEVVKVSDLTECFKVNILIVKSKVTPKFIL